MENRTCPQCKALRPLHDFRRWRGPKRSLHTVCNQCQPERNLADMTPKERINASAVGRPRAHIALVLAMNEREAAHLRYSRRPAIALAQHRETRRVAWYETLGRRLAEEHRWARMSLARARRTDADDWAAFFDAYAEVLQKMRTDISMKHYEPGPRKLTMEEANPTTHINPHTLQTLRLLYGDCRTPKSYRQPWFVEWESIS